MLKTTLNKKIKDIMPLITRQGKGSKLTIQEMDGNLTYLESLAQSGLAGSNYVYVAADGTPEENGTALQAAYNVAITMSPSETNRITVIAAPGNYKFSAVFVMDVEYVDLVSLTGNRDVVFDLDGVPEDPFIWETNTGTITNVTECFLIAANNIYVRGIRTKKYTSTRMTEYYAILDDSYLLPILVADNLPNVVIENCEAGPFSFGSTYVDGTNHVASGTFINCAGGVESFGSKAEASGSFINCQANEFAFGYNGTASGVFTGCVSGETSFGGNGTASGTFTNCVAGGGFYRSFGIIVGKLYFCRLTQGTFATVSSGGRTYYCIDGNGNTNNQ